jgi:hypothetical protein
MTYIKILEPAEHGLIRCSHCSGVGQVESYGICQFRAEKKNHRDETYITRCFTKSQDVLDGVEYCGIHYNVMERRKQT